MNTAEMLASISEASLSQSAQYRHPIKMHPHLIDIEGAIAFRPRF
ncbi:MAG: hypothetical protein QXP70_06080 [Methanomassiliicoccales archaeon]